MQPSRTATLNSLETGSSWPGLRQEAEHHRRPPRSRRHRRHHLLNGSIVSHGKGTGNLHVLKAVTSLTVKTIKAVGASDIYSRTVLGPDGLPLADTGLIHVSGHLQIDYACVIDMLTSNPFWARSVRVKSGGSTGGHPLSNEGKYETAFAHEIGKVDPVLIEVFFDGSEKLLPSANKLIVK